MIEMVGVSVPTLGSRLRLGAQQAAIFFLRHPFLLVLALFICAVVRRSHWLVYPVFYAEDGVFFFKETVEIGAWKTLLLPVIGHYHLAARVIASLAYLFPLEHAPLVYAIFAGLFSSWVLSLFSRPGFRWLVPSDAMRILICFVSIFLWGNRDAFFSLCALNYQAFLGAVLLLLRQRENEAWAAPFRELPLFFFLFFSSGQSLVLFPVVLLLWRFTRQLPYLWVFAALVFSVTANFLASRQVTDMHLLHPLTLENVFQGVRVYLENFSMRLIVGPILGFKIERIYNTLSGVTVLGLHAAAALFFTWMIRKLFFSKPTVEKPHREVLLWTTVLCVMVLYPFIWWVRSYAPMTYPQFLYGWRYALPASVLTLILYTRYVTQGSWGGKRWAKVFLGYVFFQMVFHEPPIRTPRPHATFHTAWPIQASTLERLLQEKVAGRLKDPVQVPEISIAPEGWVIPTFVIPPD